MSEVFGFGKISNFVAIVLSIKKWRVFHRLFLTELTINSYLIIIIVVVIVVVSIIIIIRKFKMPVRFERGS